MKLLTPEQEREHYSNVLKGGWGGLIGGTALSTGILWTLGRRFPAIRHLNPSFHAFLVTGTGGFAAIIYADRYSRNYEATHNPDSAYTSSQMLLKKQLQTAKPLSQRASEWGLQNRYRIVLSSWVVSMAVALALINRKPFLSRAQKLVQARVFAQGSTLAVVIANLAFEGAEDVMNENAGEVLDSVDRVRRERYPGQNRWMDMVAAGEQRIKEQEQMTM
ncbi:hypothetical protein D6C99_08788 [Aureobasidium pullulans]|nr:hypothetical protein D6C99_08788 [Aureobasidium pullulans]